MDESPHSDETEGKHVRAEADDPEAKLYSTVPLEGEDGNTYVIELQNVGRENMEGGGEWPDRGTPPRAPAPGARDGGFGLKHGG